MAGTQAAHGIRWSSACLAAALLLMPAHGDGAAEDVGDPFAFFRPWLLVTGAERARLDGGDVLVRTLPVVDGQLAVFAAARLQAPPEALVAWTHAIDDLKRGPFVLAVRRFSDPPSADDLGTLALDDGDLDAIRRCQPGNCRMKLTVPDIESFRAVIAAAGPGWKEAVQEEFRRRVLARVNLYRSEGMTAFPPYVDRGRPVHPDDTFARIMTRSPYLARGFPSFAAAIAGHVAASGPHVASFYYWSKERYGAGKNVVTVTHVQMLQPGAEPPVPSALVVSKQLFATHYIDGALGLTSVVCGPPPGSCYLAYLNRTQVDVLGGVLGLVKRALIERRIEADTPALVRELRRRLESGDPVSAADPAAN